MVAVIHPVSGLLEVTVRDKEWAVRGRVPQATFTFASNGQRHVRQVVKASLCYLRIPCIVNPAHWGLFA
jgi:hypothetical protein